MNPVVLGAIISGVATLGASAIGAQSQKKAAESGAGLNLTVGGAPPKKPQEDDALKRMLIDAAGRKRASEAAEASAEDALREEVTADLGAAQSAATAEDNALKDVAEDEEDEATDT